MWKIIRRVLAVLLAVTGLLLAVVPAGYVEATSTHGDYEYDGSTLVKYRGSETDLTIPNWITKVGKDAFAGNTNLRKINLPDSVKTIDYQAFEGCTNLQEVVIPKSVRTIGPSAFSGCSSLYAVNIPEKCDSIGSGAFAGCKALSGVDIDPNNVSYVCKDSVIYSIDGSKLVSYLAGRPFTSYQMPGTVKEIEEYAFWGSDNLNKISISPNVDAIPEYAFTYCNGLSNVTLPSSVERINAYSFADCNNLEYINIPETVGYIDDKAFYMTNGTILYFVNSIGDVVKKVNAADVEAYGNGSEENGELENEESLYVDENANVDNTDNSGTNSDIDRTDNAENPEAGMAITDETYYDGYYSPSKSGDGVWIDNIENRDYSDNLNPQNGELASSQIVGGSAVLMMPSDVPVMGFDIDFAEKEDYDYGYNYGYGNKTSEENTEYDKVGSTFVLYKGSENDVSVPEDVDTIGVRAFYNNKNLENVELPNKLDLIDDFAFARSNLKSVTIPDGTQKIDYAAFYSCPNLSEVFFPDSLTKISLGAFDNTPFINNFQESGEQSDYLIVGDGILLSYKGKGGNIIIPDGVKHIAGGVFKNNARITGVIVPGSVCDIGEEAFCGCKNLKELTLNEGIRNIEDRAFKGSSLNCVYFPDSVENIGLGAFDTSSNGNTLKSVIFKGNNVPNVSFNDTATRLSARDLRTKAFEGTNSAIISQNCNVKSGTIFDPNYYGFEGQIYTYENQVVNDEQEADTKEDEDTPSENSNNKCLILEYSTSAPDESGNVLIDPHVDIANTGYIMDNVKDYAFDYYKNWNNYFDYEPKNVLIDGNSSDALIALLKENGFLNGVEDEKETEKEDEQENLNEVIPDLEAGEITELSNVKCELRSNVFMPGSTAVASIADCTDDLNLIISDCSSDEDVVKTAFENKYGFVPENGIHCFDFYLTDKSGTVPIHKLGNSKLEMELPLPMEYVGDKSLTMACFDENGVLEELSTDVSEDESGNKKIRFVTDHCSLYFMYSKESFISGPVYTEDIVPSDNAESVFSVSAVVNSLYKKTPVGISAKWFVVIILFALSGILVLYKNPKKKKRRG